MKHKTALPAFMLLEVGIVLALLMLMLAYSFSSISWFNALTVRAQLMELASCVRYYQHIARMTRIPQKITFGQEHSYIAQGHTYQLARGVQFGIIPAVYGPPSDPKKLVTKPVTFPGRTLTIFPDGAMQAGTIYITDAAKSCIYALTVPIAHTAYLRAYCHQQGMWERII